MSDLVEVDEGVGDELLALFNGASEAFSEIGQHFSSLSSFSSFVLGLPSGTAAASGLEPDTNPKLVATNTKKPVIVEMKNPSKTVNKFLSRITTF
mmetsp:Transcript_25962/g.68392  ORF Transcript_25962/g.68392 Transcript_25962/m.68392 type:complete len:95 (-) Transcript_25962:116-400(-)